MSELITLINYIAVSIFGSILSAAFCGIGKEKKQRNLIVFTVGVALIYRRNSLLFLWRKGCS